MSLSKEDIELIDGHFDRRLDQNDEENFNTKYLIPGEFRDEVDFRNNLIENIEELREDDLRKQFTSHMKSIDEKKKKKTTTRRKLFVAASFVLALASAVVYLTSDTKNHQKLFDEYYMAYDGVALSRNQTSQSSQGTIKYLSKNYGEALPLLLNLEEHNTSDLLMIGICYLEAKQPMHALKWFSKIEADTNQDIASVRDWYIALAYLQNGQLSQAKEILSSKVITQSMYSKRSSALLNEDLFHE